MNTLKTEQERLEILRRYRRMIEAWHTRKEVKDQWEVRKAFRLAAGAHKDMRRKSGEPFIYHPLEVATIAAGEIGLGRTAIIAALLHDTVEDTEMLLEDIEALFGKKVATIIDGLTKIDKIKGTDTTAQVETLKKIILTLSDDVRVILVKLADRLHNMRTLDVMRVEQQKRAASETLHIYAPIARRLGLHAIKSELSDLALKYINPVAYNEILKRFENFQRERDAYIGQFVTPIMVPLKRMNENNKVIVSEKSVYSLWQRMEKTRKHIENFSETFSLDIIIDNGEEDEGTACWSAYAQITKIYKPVNAKINDFISTPKMNGYKAIHTSLIGPDGIWVEVHIRTVRMHEIAQRGFAALWKYNLIKDNHSINLWLKKTRDFLLENEDDAVNFLDIFTKEFLTDEVIVFGVKDKKKKNQIVLPKGATVLDFAYAIHSDLGNHSMGAYVNYINATFDQTLNQSDEVLILSSNSAKPEENWLEIVTTGKAKNAINAYFKNERRKFYIEGEKKFRAICKQIDETYSKEIINRLVYYFRYNYGKIDLFYNIAVGNLDAKTIKEVLNPENRKTAWYRNLSFPFIPRTSKAVNQDVDETKPETLPDISSYRGDLNKLNYVVAKCCNPIPGDNIVGIAVPGHPIEIHRTDCEQGIRLMSMYGRSVIKATWKENENITFLAGLQIEAMDKPGLLHEITKYISDKFNLNIRSFHLETKQGLMLVKITLFVKSIDKLNEIIASLKKIKAIRKISRITKIDRI